MSVLKAKASFFGQRAAKCGRVAPLKCFVASHAWHQSGRKNIPPDRRTMLLSIFQ